MEVEHGIINVIYLHTCIYMQQHLVQNKIHRTALKLLYNWIQYTQN